MWNKQFVSILTLCVIGTTGAVAWSDEDEASGAAVAKYLPTAGKSWARGCSGLKSGTGKG